MATAVLGGHHRGLLGIPLRQRGLVLALVCVPVVYLLLTASLEMFVTRYNVPTIPFVIVLSIVPFRVLLCGWTATGHTPFRTEGGGDERDDRQAEPAS